MDLGIADRRALVCGASRGLGFAVSASMAWHTVVVTSLTVRSPVQQLDLSTATRLALTGYVAGVARQVAPQNVTINNLLPGTIATERIRDLGEMAEKLIAKVPMGRAGRPEEFGAMCAFLCSHHAAYITAQNILMDGGLCSFTV